MAKSSGLLDYFACDDSGGSLRDISNDVTSLGVNVGQELIPITGLDKAAVERLIGMGDGSFAISGVFNSASNMSHDVFKVRTGTRCHTPLGATLQGCQSSRWRCWLIRTTSLAVPMDR